MRDSTGSNIVIQSNNIPLSIYVHIPWCVKKCPYCDFNSHQLDPIQQRLPEKDYLQALREDINSEVHWLKQNEYASTRKIVSIFFGGGTPSLMSADFYWQVMDLLRANFEFEKDIEVTIEANPGAVDEGHFKGYVAAGINRLSLGVQTFSDQALQSLGRIHDRTSIYRAFDTARHAGFNNINIDLMHGLPNQSINEGIDDLQSAFELSPEHLSWYQLTIEPNTVFFHSQPLLPDENILDNLYERGLDALSDAGYEQYEVSAFAKNELQAKHNLNYWQFGDYIGVGAGAHGKLTESTGGLRRRWKTRMPQDYMNASSKIAGNTVIDQKEIALEFMMNAMRLNEGFSNVVFEGRTGLRVDTIKENLTTLEQKGLVGFDADHVWPTSKGHRFFNDIISEFN